ncbi:hypothetical protein ABFA07_022618 [Porites harrisoni]
MAEKQSKRFKKIMLSDQKNGLKEFIQQELKLKITEDAELTQSEDTKLRYLKFWCLKYWINVYQLVKIID